MGMLFLTIANYLVDYPTYSYVGHDQQQPHIIRQHAATYMVDSSGHGAPLPAPPLTKVTQHVG
jgi:hypothetical protein